MITLNFNPNPANIAQAFDFLVKHPQELIECKRLLQLNQIRMQQSNTSKQMQIPIQLQTRIPAQTQLSLSLQPQLSSGAPPQSHAQSLLQPGPQTQQQFQNQQQQQQQLLVEQFRQQPQQGSCHRSITSLLLSSSRTKQ
eukprot:TRINITY_DN8498_c0_g6_i2.p1 TRINITY_DN8498_c0_g6~~TRINITY_DN8498_c0_g6_i2.p1  ORF type:complete len:139 (-),score=36.81 TRINITY_DN8498_c0_g6_i2:41-457(-)